MKRKISWIVLLSLMLSGAAWADKNDPVLPEPPKSGAAEGMAVGSLISTAAMTTADGNVVIWGYRKNGHNGNYNWDGHYVGFENNSTTQRLTQPRLETVRDFKDPKYNPHLASQKVKRLFTTAHTLMAQTDEGELWGWGDNLHGTAGCIGTGFETGTSSTNRHTDYNVNTISAYFKPGTTSSERTNAPHYQSRPCPIFSQRVRAGTYGSPINLPNGEKVKWVDGGEYNVVVLTGTGDMDDTTHNKIWTWGSNAFYQTTYLTPIDSEKGMPFDITSLFQTKNASGAWEQHTIVLAGGGYEAQYAVTTLRGKYFLWGWGRSYAKSLVDDPASYGGEQTINLPSIESLTDPTAPPESYTTDINNRLSSTVYNNVYLSKPVLLGQYDSVVNKAVPGFARSNVRYVNGGYAWTAVLGWDGNVYASGSKVHTGVGANKGNAVSGSSSSLWDFDPQIIMGPDCNATPDCPRIKVEQLIVRYAGGVAYSKEDPDAIYTWGGWGSGGGDYYEVYGSKPTRRQLAGTLKSLGATKEAVYYTTTDNALYGVGYGDQRVINLCDNNFRSWDRDTKQYTRKNSMNWTRKRTDNDQIIHGGYRIPYENLIDVIFGANSDMPYLTLRPQSERHCDGGNFTDGFYKGKNRNTVREWTGYDDGRDGDYPTSTPGGRCGSDNC